MFENQQQAGIVHEVDWFLSLATKAWSVGRQLRRDISLQLAAEGITAEDFLTLCLLRRSGVGISQVELADELGISTAQTSGLVERMRQQGWISAERDPRDRRRQCWQATPLGLQEEERIARQLQPLAAISMQGIPQQECEQLTRILDRLRGTSAPSTTEKSSEENPSSPAQPLRRVA